MNAFYKVLGNAIVATITNNFGWFALTYWGFIETQSVLSTSIIGGLFLVTTALPAFWYGSIVDHNKKKYAMLLSSCLTLGFFIAAYVFHRVTPEESFKTVASVPFWIFVLLVMFATAAGNIRNIALGTVVTLLVPEDRRDKANGLVGMVMGISFGGASLGSGYVLAEYGMGGVLLLTCALTAIVIVHLLLIRIPEDEIVHSVEKPKKIDIRGTVVIVGSITGLFPLIFYTTFNNFLGGVFMALMDAYGLTLVSLKFWGVLWGILSSGFIVGGLVIAKFGLGKNPLKALFATNITLWTICMFFTIQPSIVLLIFGMAIWVTLAPVIEATEHTIMQKVVPFERQGRVFGFAQSVEQAASPITAFLIGPIAQFIFIPFMTTGRGVELIGSWFGTGTGRGIALVFILTGIIGLITTLIAMFSRSYKALARSYAEG
jgi:DHA3 family multidrug efflux protein-like MFS transporter